MKINNINPLNFKRAIEIRSNSMPYGLEHDKKSKSNPPLHVVEMIKQNKPKMYNGNFFRKIKDSLRSAIGDCAQDSKFIISRVIQGRLYIFTGKESEMAHLIIENAKKQIKGNLSKELRRTKIMQRDKRLLELVENGCNNKPHTEIDVISEKGKAKEVIYRTMYYKDGSIKVEAKMLSDDNLIF